MLFPHADRHIQCIYKVKPLKSGHLQVLKNLSIIEGCLVLGVNLKDNVTFGTKCFVHYSQHGMSTIGRFYYIQENVCITHIFAVSTKLRGQNNTPSSDMTKSICHLISHKFSQFLVLSGHFGTKKSKIIQFLSRLQGNFSTKQKLQAQKMFIYHVL